jgi:hypothetical protein
VECTGKIDYCHSKGAYRLSQCRINRRGVYACAPRAMRARRRRRRRRRAPIASRARGAAAAASRRPLIGRIAS